jgi:DNA-binding transcriptional MerR regulator
VKTVGIGEAARLLGVKPHVLRYWESEFRWMAPAKSRSKQRLYRKRDIEVIQLIRTLLHEERYTNRGARKRLRELGVARALEAPERETPAEAASTRDAGPGVAPGVREALRRVREELVALRAAL